MPFAATWMDPEIIILSKISHTEKDKCHTVITCMWTLKYDTSELIYKRKQPHRHRKQIYGYQKGKGVWEE